MCLGLIFNLTAKARYKFIFSCGGHILVIVVRPGPLSHDAFDISQYLADNPDVERWWRGGWRWWCGGV